MHIMRVRCRCGIVSTIVATQLSLGGSIAGNIWAIAVLIAVVSLARRRIGFSYGIEKK